MNYSEEQELKAQLNRIEEKLDQLLNLSNSGQSFNAPKEPAFLAECRNLLANGKKIQAIKLHREHSGLGLKEAKKAVEAMGNIPPATSTNTNDEAQFHEEIVSLVGKSKKIMAIKKYRERYAVGLKEAKESVESIYANHQRGGW